MAEVVRLNRPTQKASSPVEKEKAPVAQIALIAGAGALVFCILYTVIIWGVIDASYQKKMAAVTKLMETTGKGGSGTAGPASNWVDD